MERYKIFIFSILIIFSLTQLHAEEPKRLGLGVGVELMNFENASYWNLGDLSYTSPEKVDYKRFNDRAKLLDFSLIGSYILNSFVSSTVRLGFGSKNLDNGTSILVENPQETLSKIFKQSYTKYSGSLGLKLTLIDVSLLGSDRKDFSLKLLGDAGIYYLGVKALDSGLVDDARLFIFEESTESIFLSFAPGLEIVVLGSVSASLYITSLIPIEGIPSNINPTILSPISFFVSYYL